MRNKSETNPPWLILLLLKFVLSSSISRYYYSVRLFSSFPFFSSSPKGRTLNCPFITTNPFSSRLHITVHGVQQQTPKAVPVSFTCYIEPRYPSLFSSQIACDILKIFSILEESSSPPWIRSPSSPLIRFVIAEISDERSLRGSSYAPFYEVPL